MKRRNKWRVRKVGDAWWVERRVVYWSVIEMFDTFPAAVWLADQRARM